MKACTVCGVVKSSSDYYRDRRALDGRYSSCKECRKKLSASRVAYMREYMRTYRKIEANKEGIRKYQRKYQSKYSQRRKWYEKIVSAVNSQIRRGLLIRKPCESCGAEKSEAHHADYNKPFEIMWLCKEHHSVWHLNNKPIYPINFSPPNTHKNLR